MNIITNIFKELLDFAFSVTGDWGMAIVLLTLVVRGLTLPLSLKQKINMRKQRSFIKATEVVKNKYKNDKNKLEQELNELNKENMKTVVGGLVNLIQLPIVSGLYMTIGRLPIEAITMIVPWVISIKAYDSRFIVPIIYTLISLSPNLLSYFKLFNEGGEKPKFKFMIPTVIISLVITIKAPVALGIYFITSSMVSLIEEIGFRLYNRNRVFS